MFAVMAPSQADSFVLTNNLIDTSSIIQINTQNTASTTSGLIPTVAVSGIVAGSCTITITNNDSVHSTLLPPVIQFSVYN